MSMARIRAIMKRWTCRHTFEAIEAIGNVVTLQCPWCEARKVRIREIRVD